MPAEFLLIVTTVILIPGVDQLMVLRNTLAQGRGAGIATACGIGLASSVQAILVSFGIGAVIVSIQPLFETIRWLGVAYLVWLGLGALRSALRGNYATDDTSSGTGPMVGFRDGVVCNITNPKILVFYLALLPQYVDQTAPVLEWMLFAMVLPTLGTLMLLGMALGVNRAREILLRRVVRRTIDGLSGVLLIGFGLRLAREA